MKTGNLTIYLKNNWEVKDQGKRMNISTYFLRAKPGQF